MSETTKKPTFKTFGNFLWAFKKTLVCRYIWGVDDASKFFHDQLEICYNEGLTCEETYIKIFGREHLGYVDEPPKPIL